MALTQITEKGIKDGEIINADINASAAIAGTKISPDFGSQNIVTTGTLGSGNFSLTSTQPRIRLIDSNTNPDLSIINEDGVFNIYDDTNSASRFTIDAGKIVSKLNHDFDAGIDVTGAITGTGAITLGNGSGVNWGDTSARIIGESGGSGLLRFDTNGGEKMRIDSSGRILIGHTANVGRHEAGNSSFQVSGTSRDDTSIAIGRWSADDDPARLEFSKSRNATIGNNTAVQSGDELGHINFSGNDGTRFLGAAYIRGFADNPIADYDCAGYLTFGTNYGTTSPTERMRIDSAGNTHFGSSGTLNDSNVVSVVPSDGRISFGMDGRSSFVTSENGAYIYSGDGVSGTTVAGDLILQSRSNQDRTIRFVTGSSPAQRVSITNNGLLFGTDTAAANALDDYETGTWTVNTSVSSPNQVYSASYVKIGDSVTVSAYLACPTSSDTNNFQITSLPFTSKGSSNYWIGAAYSQVHTSNNFFVQINPGNNDLYTYERVGNTVAYSTLSGMYLLFTCTYFTA